MQLIGLAGEPHALLPEPIVWVCTLCAAQGFADHGEEAGVVHQWSFLAKALDGNLVPDAVEGETTFCTIRHCAIGRSLSSVRWALHGEKLMPVL